MSKLLQNTLEIIASISLSTIGYLLKIKQESAEIIVFTGEDKDRFSIFNNELAALYQNEKINPSEVNALQSLKKISTDHSLLSVFTKKIYLPKNKEFAVYLVLFSNRLNNYNDNNLKMVMNTVETLTDQIKSTPKAARDALLKEDSSGDKLNKVNLPASPDQLLKSILDSSEDFIFILDNNGAFLSVNNNGAQILDYSRDELIGKHFLELTDFKGKTSAAKAFQQVLRSKSQYKFECTLLSKRGKEINFEISGKPVNKESNIIGMIGVGKDITQKRFYDTSMHELNYKLIESNRLLAIEKARSNQRKAILEELNELKSEFISNISHELRTPLASIIGFSETIASDPEMPREMKDEFNQIILQEGKRLARLINDILDISKIESGKLDLIRTDFDVVSSVKEVIEHYKKPCSAKSITLTFDLPDEEVIINADKERIIKSFHELLNNAVKFTKDGGRITIIAQNLYREFELIISDTGIGISEKDLPYIYQKFYKISRPGSETQGTGLGLVFVKQIIDLHKGLIIVQSEIDRGSSFIVKLPKSIKAQKNKG